MSQPKLNKLLIYHFTSHNTTLCNKLKQQIEYDNYASNVDPDDDYIIEPPFDRYKFFNELFSEFHLVRSNEINGGGAWSKNSMSFYFDNGNIIVEFVYTNPDTLNCFIWGCNGNTDIWSLFEHRRKPRDTIQDEQKDLLEARSELFFKNTGRDRIVPLFEDSIKLATMRKPYDIVQLSELLAEASVLHQKHFINSETYLLIADLISQKTLDASISVNVFYHLR